MIDSRRPHYPSPRLGTHTGSASILHRRGFIDSDKNALDRNIRDEEEEEEEEEREGADKEECKDILSDERRREEEADGAE